MLFYAYILRDPRNNVPFYVGKGKGDRAFSHTRPSNLKRRSRKAHKIKKLLRENLEPLVEIVKQDLIESDAFRLEVKLIQQYGRLDLGNGTLCNHSDGGEGPTNVIPWNKGKRLSPETCKKMSESRLASPLARKCMMKNLKKMIKLNTGKKRPKHSKFMKKNNPKHQIIENEPVRTWVHISGKTIFGTRATLHQKDPTTKISELGQVISGKYQSHRGWSIQEPIQFPKAKI